ncbi:Pectinesterase inhibitor domain [Dillenia turbinata]|uniref:Pectinesterase inhibitor domain n=1 Tax=Dillenia turbinata TaxID=194707 RepID=A0AAN8UKS9_9MAGN
MATSYQPLLDPPRTKPLHCRALFCVLSLAAIITLASLIALRTSSPGYQSVSTLICDRAYDPVSCVSQLSELSFNGAMPSMIDEDHLTVHLKKSSMIMRNAVEMANHAKNEINSPREQAALADCVELMGISMGQVADSIVALSNLAVSSRVDAHTWLSSVLTNHFTCLDGLEGRSSCCRNWLHSSRHLLPKRRLAEEAPSCGTTCWL